MRIIQYFNSMKSSLCTNSLPSVSMRFCIYRMEKTHYRPVISICQPICICVRVQAALFFSVIKSTWTKSGGITQPVTSNRSLGNLATLQQNRASGKQCHRGKLKAIILKGAFLKKSTESMSIREKSLDPEHNLKATFETKKVKRTTMKVQMNENIFMNNEILYFLQEPVKNKTLWNAKTNFVRKGSRN